MSRKLARRWLYVALGLVFLLRNDLWLWHDRSFLLGLPVGLTYHIALCVAVAVIMALLVRYGWPRPAEPESDPQAHK